MNIRNWATVSGVVAAMCLQVGGAQAQSSVAVYGRIDLGVRHGPQDLTKSEDSVSYMDDSSRARLGFMGTEDLGGGNSAFFQLEHRFNSTTGAQDGPVYWKDKAWVGLANKSVGQVRLGRMSSPQDWVGVAGRYEAFFGDSYASNGTRGAKSAAKWDSTVYYETPNWGGLNMGLALQAGPGERKDARGLHVGYASGPLSFMATHQIEQDPTAGASASDGMKTTTLGAFYDFGVIKPMFTYARSTDLAANDRGREVVWTLGARIPAGPGEVRVSYRSLKDDLLNGATRAADREGARLGVGYHYPLSKRTSVNLSLVRERIKAFEADGSLKYKRAGTGYEVALRHSF